MTADFPPITRAEIEALHEAFSFEDHEIREGSNRNGTQWFAYVRRSAIIRRLEEVFPGEWSFELHDVKTDGKYATATGRLTIRGLVRELNGGNSGNIGENDEKGAGTDAFKRAASMWGIGLYLQDAPKLWTKGGYVSGEGKTRKINWQERNKQEQEALGKFQQWLDKLTGAPSSPKQQPPANGNKPQQGDADPDDGDAEGSPSPDAEREQGGEVSWPSRASLQELFDVTRRKLIPDGSDQEIAALAGVNKPFALETWGKLYPTRTAAAQQIKHAWEKPPTPSKNGNGDSPSQPSLTGGVGAAYMPPASKGELSSGQSAIVAAELGRGGEVLLFESGVDEKADLTLHNRAPIIAINDDWAAYARSWQPGQRYTFLLDSKGDLVADWKEIVTALGNIAVAVQTIAPAPVDIPF